MSSPFISTFILFFSLLNPFLMSIYMIGLIRHTETRVFNKALIQGSLIAYVVFLLFAWGGEAIFNRYLNVRFESFLIFGGLIFLVIGYRYVFQGADTIGEMRGAPEHLAGTVAMPFMIGPGTISAAVVTGMSMTLLEAAIVIALVLFVSCSVLIAMKFSHDHLRYSHAKYIDRYFDIVGRLAALLIGTIAVDMIVNGVTRLIDKV
ncbi:MarC family protein [Acinetobacter baumannii]|uniref:MarC family protein n=4 Tax=Acinetobacter calcoaceticus/baumannii complex TaxID=909768 RepID=UPI0002E2259E|nr:MarC family protein [Acinetobacter baumannii]EHU2361890.1 MarC family protein [Acinetobacter baumannii]EHU3228174.1 MarC family protein [Acinetobacter baumannii]EJA9989819.1 MarC family protein [Acinetobacter baumannii]EJC1499518.1 MarC family protein [Acinetobacter baumannii]EJC8093727.1 MarC family protein [Acinetobacter baumannii]